MTGHGFRAMAATLLNEMGPWHSDAIERQLAHCDNNAVRRAYTRGEYWDERVKMMQHWSDHLDFVRDGAKMLKGRFGKAGRRLQSTGLGLELGRLLTGGFRVDRT